MPIAGYVLILVFITDGYIQTRDYQFRDPYACAESREEFVVSMLKRKVPLLVAQCFPVSRTWGL